MSEAERGRENDREMRERNNAAREKGRTRESFFLFFILFKFGFVCVGFK